MTPEYLYRYVDYPGGDYSDHLFRLYAFRVLRETPCGFWIREHYTGRERWVSKTSRKRYAYPSIEEAEESFRIRKTRQRWLAVQQWNNACKALRAELPTTPTFE